MNSSQAQDIANAGIAAAKAFLEIGRDCPPGTPLFQEMQQAALEALSWANDDEVIDALYEADLREQRRGEQFGDEQ